jgi:multiple sugar transport system substrate-binding protein
MVAVEAARPPDFAFGLIVSNHISKWAYEDRLANLTDVIGAFSNLFDPDALAWVRLVNARTGQRALYALPMGRTTFYIHVWKSLLEQAGFTLDDIPEGYGLIWGMREAAYPR